MNFVGKIFFALLCMLGSLGYFKACVYFIREYSNSPNLFLAFGIGGLLYALLWMFVFSKRGKFWSVVEHEMTHALFALMFFKKVHSFTANRGTGGSVEIEGDNFMIALAPYFFPLLTIVIMIIKPSVPNTYQWIFNLMMGFTLMFHLLHLMMEFNPSQPDVRKSGMLFSMVVVAFFNLFFVGLSIASLGSGGWTDIVTYLEFGFRESTGVVLAFWDNFYEQTLAKLAS